MPVMLIFLDVQILHNLVPYSLIPVISPSAVTLPWFSVSPYVSTDLIEREHLLMCLSFCLLSLVVVHTD